LGEAGLGLGQGVSLGFSFRVRGEGSQTKGLVSNVDTYKELIRVSFSHNEVNSLKRVKKRQDTKGSNKKRREGLRKTNLVYVVEPLDTVQI
jgi:hypothetical protein